MSKEPNMNSDGFGLKGDLIDIKIEKIWVV